MYSMKVSKLVKTIISFCVLIGLLVGGYILYDRGRPAPIPMKQKLFAGVTYRRIVHLSPRPMIIHVLVIDTKTQGISFLVTPPDTKGDMPLKARTTTQFMEEFGPQIAINGDGFIPWWSHSVADYYPHVGDPVRTLGVSASAGKVYAEGVPETVGIKPTLYISRKNVLSFNKRPDNIYNALSGDRMLVQQGSIVEDLDTENLNPRTAIGINKNGRLLYLVVVDGRQPLYSEGATFPELAQIMLDQGAFFAMALDGGGSSTMVYQGKDGKPVILNSPIDNYIPGRERPVANHLGIFVNP
jgi:phosphodiester glycosidase